MIIAVRNLPFWGMVALVVLLVAFGIVLIKRRPLRRSMLSMIDTGKDYQAHPAFWAPFVLVGEGGAGRWERDVCCCKCERAITSARERSAWGQLRQNSKRAQRVRFTPDSRHGADITACRKRANKRHSLAPAPRLRFWRH